MMAIHFMMSDDMPQQFFYNSSMRGSRKFCQRWSNSGNVVYFLEGGREDSNTIKSGTLSTRQRNAVQMALFKWRFAGGPMIAQHNTSNADLKAL